MPFILTQQEATALTKKEMQSCLDDQTTESLMRTIEWACKKGLSCTTYYFRNEDVRNSYVSLLNDLGYICSSHNGTPQAITIIWPSE